MSESYIYSYELKDVQKACRQNRLSTLTWRSHEGSVDQIRVRVTNDPNYDLIVQRNPLDQSYAVFPAVDWQPQNPAIRHTLEETIKQLLQTVHRVTLNEWGYSKKRAHPLKGLLPPLGIDAHFRAQVNISQHQLDINRMSHTLLEQSETELEQVINRLDQLGQQCKDPNHIWALQREVKCALETIQLLHHDLLAHDDHHKISIEETAKNWSRAYNGKLEKREEKENIVKNANNESAVRESFTQQSYEHLSTLEVQLGNISNLVRDVQQREHITGKDGSTPDTDLTKLLRKTIAEAYPPTPTDLLRTPEQIGQDEKYKFLIHKEADQERELELRLEHQEIMRERYKPTGAEKLHAIINAVASLEPSQKKSEKKQKPGFWVSSFNQAAAAQAMLSRP